MKVSAKVSKYNVALILVLLLSVCVISAVLVVGFLLFEEVSFHQIFSGSQICIYNSWKQKCSLRVALRLFFNFSPGPEPLEPPRRVGGWSIDPTGWYPLTQIRVFFRRFQVMTACSFLNVVTYFMTSSVGSSGTGQASTQNQIETTQRFKNPAGF